MAQNDNGWRNTPTNPAFDQSQDIGMGHGFDHDRIVPQRASYSSNTPHFETAFHSPADRMDQSASQSFARFQDAYQVVLDGRNGQIILPSSRQNLDSDPMSRFYDNPLPWTAQGIDGMASWASGPGSGPRFITSNQSVIRPPYVGYREPAKSNPESHFTGKQQQDSGYATNGPRTAKSVISGGDYSDQVEDTQSFVNGVDAMDIGSTKTSQRYYATGSQAERPGPSESWSDHGEALLTCQYPECTEEVRFKNQSDLKKHTQRHEKPHKCNFPGCQRKDGFTTKNDLDRHKKSLHGIVPSNTNDRSFKCAGLNCNKKGKIWPRLDNFKSHCSRMHSAEDVEELVKKSEVEPDKREEASGSVTTGPPATSRQIQSGDGIDEATLLLDLSQGTQTNGSSFPSNIHHNPSRNMMEPTSSSIRSGTRNLSQGSIRGNGVRSNESSSHNQHHQSSHQSLESTSSKSTKVSIDRAQTSLNTPLVRSPESNDALAEQLQQSSFSRKKSNGIDHNSATAGLQDFSRSLVSESASKLDLSPTSVEKLRRIIDAKVANLFKSLSHAKRSSEDAALDDPAPKAKRVFCRICLKTMDRPCDLKKHEKRHSRPWGCTNATCPKTFGSKNDWKRHENSQHYQLETWRCHQPSATSKINQCAKIFFRRDPFQAHLRKDHSMSNEDNVRDECRKRRIGRNWQNGFWCGFCKDIIKLQTRGLEAWDERFNHIDDLHFKQGKNIDDWYPMDRDLPKGRLRLEDLQDGKISNTWENDSESDDSELEDLSLGIRPQQNSMEAGELGTMAKPVRMSSPTPEPVDPTTWYCSNCRHGPMAKTMYMHCINCGKRR